MKSLVIAGLILFMAVLPAPARIIDASQVVKDFEGRIAKYIELHKQQAVDQKSTDSPEKLAENRRQMAEKMRAARPDARQGDIFAPGVAGYFRRQIAVTLTGADGAKVRASLRHAEPLPSVPLQVNARYPEKVPLQSTPPSLLLNLPRLPQELQYRIIGNDLVLYDVAADMIVDFIPGALPSIKP